jgi:ATP-dependent Zn protease
LLYAQCSLLLGGSTAEEQVLNRDAATVTDAASSQLPLRMNSVNRVVTMHGAPELGTITLASLAATTSGLRARLLVEEASRLLERKRHSAIRVMCQLFPLAFQAGCLTIPGNYGGG